MMDEKKDLFRSCLDSTRNELRPILLRPNEAAQVLAISPRKLWELTDCGEIPCVRIGRAVRYSVEDLKEWIKVKKRYRWIGQKEQLIKHFNNLAGAIRRA